MPAELRISATRVRLEAVVDPTFLKSIVTFVEVPDVGGLGEIDFKEMSADEPEDGAGDEDGLGDGAGDELGDVAGDELGDGAGDGLAWSRAGTCTP